MKRLNQTTLFLLVTFVVSFSLAGAYALLVDDVHNKTTFTILGIVYMFIPTLSVLFVKKGIHKEPIKKVLMISFRWNRWFWVAWLIMPLLSFITVGVSSWIPGAVFDPKMSGMFEQFESKLSPEQIQQMHAAIAQMPIHPIWITLLQGLLAGITVNAIAAFGEELGWRGFLLQSFRHLSFAKATLIIGFIWGIWHAPLILMGHNYPEHPIIGVGMMVIFCLLTSGLFIYVTLKAKSVIAAAIIHGTLNATAGYSIMLITGGNDLTVGMTGLAGFLVLLLVLAGLFLFDRYVTKDRILTSTIQEHLPR